MPCSYLCSKHTRNIWTYTQLSGNSLSDKWIWFLSRIMFYSISNIPLVITLYDISACSLSNRSYFYSFPNVFYKTSTILEYQRQQQSTKMDRPHSWKNQRMERRREAVTNFSFEAAICKAWWSSPLAYPIFHSKPISCLIWTQGKLTARQSPAQGYKATRSQNQF